MKGLVSKETGWLRRWESKMPIIGIKQIIDKGEIITLRKLRS